MQETRDSDSNAQSYVPGDMDEEAKIVKQVIFIYGVLVYTLIAVGIPGNILTIIVLCKSRVKSVSVKMIITLTVVDCLTLVGHLIMKLTSQVAFSTPYLCSINLMIISLCQSLANWALVLICLDRFIAVCFPLKHKIFTWRRYCTALMVIGLVLVICVGLLNLLFVDKYCEPRYISSLYTDAIYFFVHILLPFATITIFTVMVVVKLNFCDTNEDLTAFKGRLRQQLEQTMTRLMVSSLVFFFTLNVPITVYFGVYFLAKRVNEVYIRLIPYCVTSLLMLSSHSFNFFIYCLFVNGFRKLIVSLIRGTN